MNKEHLHPEGRPYTKEEFVEKIKTDKSFAKRFADLGPGYGKQWRSWTKKKMYLSTDGSYEKIYDEADQTVIDQIANAINLLKTDPDSRRIVVNAYNVGELDQMVLPPCHMMFQFYTRELSRAERVENYNSKFENKIEVPFIKMKLEDGIEKIIDTTLNQASIPTRAISLKWTQRSVDVGLGLPFNIASYALLLELVAKAVNMVPEDLIGDLGDCHIYNNHVDGLKEQLTRIPYKLPSLNINTEWWPTESGECGVGPIDAIAVFNSFTNDHFCKSLLEEDIQLYNYQSHPAIRLPLSN